ncbi:unnamed protein product, partial [Callosobruchus maculatus]
CFYHAPPILQF